MNKNLFAFCVTCVLVGCGGSSDDPPSFDYSRINGTYACIAVVDKSSATFSAVFSADRLLLAVVNGGVADPAATIDDIIGSQNGYPRYSEKLGDGTQALTWAFSTDGKGILGLGATADIPNGVLDGLTASVCTRQG